MYSLLNIIVLAPLAGFLVLAVTGRYMKRSAAAAIGVGAAGVSALLTIILGIYYLSGSHEAVTVHLWKWIDIGGFSPDIAFYLDPLSMVFIFIVTFVGFLIHLYSVEYMHDDEGYARFFAYMNLFVTSMLILVLADNYLFLYLGWEGVGLCSFLLIGFWYNSKENSYAARKAFFVTRIGDTACC
jgi:NADH-quinone oxidoreductase subunit L